MKRDGWVKDADGVWILRFRYDWDSWEGNPNKIDWNKAISIAEKFDKKTNHGCFN